MPNERYTNNLDVPQEIADILKEDNYSKGDSDVSTTQLLSPIRETLLKIIYKNAKDENDDYLLKEDVSNRFASFFGTAMHSVVEEYYKKRPEIALTETRMFKEFDMGEKKIVLSGQFDLFLKKPSMLADIKTTSLSNKKAKIQWEQQLNIYAWLFKNHDRYEGDSVEGLEVKELAVFAVYKDWKLSKGGSPSKRFDIPLWGEARQEAFIMDRLQRLKDATDLVRKTGSNNPQTVMPYCSVDDRWWNNAKCKNYCTANVVCEQWKEIKNNE